MSLMLRYHGIIKAALTGPRAGRCRPPGPVPRGTMDAKSRLMVHPADPDGPSLPGCGREPATGATGIRGIRGAGQAGEGEDTGEGGDDTGRNGRRAGPGRGTGRRASGKL